MLQLLLLAILAPTAHADCDDVAILVERAEQAVIEGRHDAAGATLEQAEKALACGAVPAPKLLGRMWLAEGTRAYLQGDEKVARLAFAAASRVASELWVDSYGPQVRKIYESAAQHDPGTGSVRIHPNPEGWSKALDGHQVDFPIELAAGLHLLQVGRSAAQTDYAEIFYLPREDTYFVLTGLEDTPIVSLDGVAPTVSVAEEEPQVQPEEPASEDSGQGGGDQAVAEAQPQGEALEAQPLPEPGPAGGGFSSPVFLVVGGAAALVAGGTAALALAQDPQMEAALNQEALDRIFARQKAFGYTSYGMMGVAAAGVGLHFALTF